MSGKSYIGQTTNVKRREYDHRLPTSSCIAFRNAIQKHGWSSFTTTILHTTADLAEANRLEEQAILAHNTRAPRGYNLRSGGDTRRHSDESRKKISESNRGKVRTEEMRARMRIAAKARMTYAAKKHLSTVMTGKYISDETRKRMSDSLRGKTKPPRTEEWKRKQSAAKLGRKRSPEITAKITETKRAKREQNGHKV